MSFQHEITTAIRDEIMTFQNVVQEDEIDRILQSALINHDEEIEQQPQVLQVQDGDELYRLGSLGDFSAIIGKAKSRKTFAVSMCMAAALKNGGLFEKLKGSLPPGKEQVVFIDTEQSRFDVLTVVKRVCKLCNIDEPKNFTAYTLRAYTPDKRVKCIERIIAQNKNLGLVVIDGVKDLVSDINNTEQANDIVSRLMQWTDNHKIHICVVLHQNKGDNNARGHLGTEVVNKAETTISISKLEKNPAVSTAKVEFGRGKEFPPFGFSVDSNGLPFLVNVVNTQNASENRRSPEQFEIDINTHQQVIRSMFAEADELCYQDVVSQVGVAFQRMGISKMGANKRKDFVTRYTSDKWIIKGRKEGRKQYYQSGLG